jgi:hypothetical protein
VTTLRSRTHCCGAAHRRTCGTTRTIACGSQSVCARSTAGGWSPTNTIRSPTAACSRPSEPGRNLGSQSASARSRAQAPIAFKSTRGCSVKVVVVLTSASSPHAAADDRERTVMNETVIETAPWILRGWARLVGTRLASRRPRQPRSRVTAVVVDATVREPPPRARTVR